MPAKFTHQAACDPSGWYGEETLDVEAVHAMAPGANILYYASASCADADFLDTLGKVVDDDQASLVSNSWSDVEEAETTDVDRGVRAGLPPGRDAGDRLHVLLRRQR